MYHVSHRQFTSFRTMVDHYTLRQNPEACQCVYLRVSQNIKRLFFPRPAQHIFLGENAVEPLVDKFTRLSYHFTFMHMSAGETFSVRQKSNYALLPQQNKRVLRCVLKKSLQYLIRSETKPRLVGLAKTLSLTTFYVPLYTRTYYFCYLLLVSVL